MRGSKPPIVSGQVFGSLTILRQGPSLGSAQSRQRTVICQCVCGHECQARASAVFKGRQVSCGCVKRRKASERQTHHGALRSGNLPASYRSWRDMRGRCLTPTHRQFPHYGGRGITVCARWESYAAFLADMGEPGPGMTIERIDVNGHYEPANCRWATKAEQALNKRTSRRISYDGKTLTVTEWARGAGLSTACLRGRLALGWPFELALSLPASHSNAVNPRSGRCAP